MSRRGATKSRGRSRAAFWVLLLGMFAVLPLGYWLILGEVPTPPPPPPPPAAPIAAAAPSLRLAETVGPVEIRRVNGEWEEAHVGSELETRDGIRTGDGGRARLVGGDQYEVQMEPGTEVAIDELDESISRLLLEGGMATAAVKGEGRHAFEVRASGSDAVARTRGGTFAISSNGSGTVAVGTREGEVELEGGGRAVIVRAGQQSVVRPGRAPSEPESIPASLLLKVQWPRTQVVTSRRIFVEGEVAPGSRVEVAGRVVRVDARGRFKVPVPLREGRNALDVRATGVGGITASERRGLRVDTRVDETTLDPDLWKKK